MDFIPEDQPAAEDVPYYDDVTAAGGWQGHSTSKDLHTLKAEVTQSFARIGGTITGFQKGAFGNRSGFRIHYTMTRKEGKLWPGKMDIAALPVKDNPRTRRSYKTRLEKSLKMALYMTRMSLDGSWFLSQLSPGYMPLMPWMIVPGEDGKNFTEMFNDRNLLALPSGDEVIEGEFEIMTPGGS